MRIFLLGFMGSGKTHWGKKLSHALDIPWVDLDAEISEKENMSIPEIFKRRGESHFRQLESRYLRTLSQNDPLLLSCGGGTPCYSDNMMFMNKAGVTVWLNVPDEIMVCRLKRKRNSRPLLKGLSDKQLTAFVKQKMEERSSFYSQAQLIVNPVKYNLNTLTEKIRSCTNLI